MFKHENNQKIGMYLSELIEKKYPSKRQFCKAYILAVGGIVNDEEIRKMANRISQITKGAKAIQTYDRMIACCKDEWGYRDEDAAIIEIERDKKRLMK